MEAGISAADAHRLLRQRIEEVTFIPATSGTSMLVLVAERDHYAADLSEYFLRTEGYDVRIALDGQEAQRLQEQRRPDLVILELLLPGGSAIELCASSPPLRFRFSRSRRLPCGMQPSRPAPARLLKPLDPLQLVSTVRDLIGTSALARAATDSVYGAVSTR